MAKTRETQKTILVTSGDIHRSKRKSIELWMLPNRLPAIRDIAHNGGLFCCHVFEAIAGIIST